MVHWSDMVGIITRFVVYIRSHWFLLMLRFSSHFQRRQLKRILGFLENTTYSNQHRPNNHSYDEFIKAFPVVTYEDIQTYIDRSIAGEKNILVPGVARNFAKSSGTTSAKSKYIPLTSKSLYRNHYRSGTDIFAWAIQKHKLFSVSLGKTLSITGSFGTIDGNPRTKAGDISAFLSSFVLWWARARRFPNQSIALLPDWNIKKEKILELAPTTDVRVIVGTPTWVLRILEGVYDMGLSVAQIWPNLRLFIHGAVAFGPYRDSFLNLTKGLPVTLIEAYNATEGFFAFGDETSNGMYLLTHHGVFYEFVKKEDWNKKNPPAIPLWEIEAGVDYALVITTYNGLVRYMVGDVIRFTNTQPYTIVIVGRTKHFINSFGEEVMGAQIEQALAFAATETNASVRSFTVAPVHLESGNGAHEWLVEFEREPNSHHEFMQKVDLRLQNLNSDYEAKRAGSGILKMPLLDVASTGTFLRYLESKKKLGGQNKIPVVTNNRELIEEIKKFI